MSEDESIALMDEAYPQQPMKPTIFVSDMQDVFLPEGDAYVWLKFVRGYDGDLELERCDEDWMGEDWLANQDDSIEGIISLHGWAFEKIEGIEFHREWTYWALEMGVAPGQPFLVRIQPPTWACSGYETPEWDCEWYWDLIRVMPRTAKQSLQAWEGFFKYREVFQQEQIKMTRRLENLRKYDLRSLYIEKKRYLWESYDLDYGPAGEGLEVQLKTKRTRLRGMLRTYHPTLVSGRSKRWDYETAARDLIKKALEELPHLSEDFLISLTRLSTTKHVEEDPLYATP